MVSSISSKKTNENKSSSGIIVVKLNSFVHFLEEFTAWQFAFEFYWPLVIIRFIIIDQGRLIFRSRLLWMIYKKTFSYTDIQYKHTNLKFANFTWFKSLELTCLYYSWFLDYKCQNLVCLFTSYLSIFWQLFLSCFQFVC